MTGRFAGRVALITGTGSGIGRATALRLAAEGAIVVGCDLDPNGARQTDALLTTAGASADTSVPVDAADDDAFRTCIAAAALRYGHI